jgi:hypothetical protein
MVLRLNMRKKKQMNRKGRSPIIPLCRWYNFVYKKKINIQKSVAGLKSLVYW